MLFSLSSVLSAAISSSKKRILSFKIVVLLADYDECRRRIESKQDKGKELDKVSKEEYLREVEFYYWLSNRLANIEILDTNELALADVTKKIARLLPHGAD